ncbi:MAG TPA: hypothetical protein VGL30_14760 [Phenylobacterium sp.]
MRTEHLHFHAPRLPHMHGPSQAHLTGGVLIALFVAAILAAVAALAFDPARLGALPPAYPMAFGPL